jgi:hypothetical protein
MIASGCSGGDDGVRRLTASGSGGLEPIEVSSGSADNVAWRITTFLNEDEDGQSPTPVFGAPASPTLLADSSARTFVPAPVLELCAALANTPGSSSKPAGPGPLETLPLSACLSALVDELAAAGAIVPGKPALVRPPAGGQVSLGPEGNITYEARPGFQGTDSFSYVVLDTDGKLLTGEFTVVVPEVRR